MRANRPTKLPAPFLRGIGWADPKAQRPRDYPFSLPFLRDPDFELDFTTPVTIIVGENGAGKSTLIEAIAALAGHDEAGGGIGYRPVSHEGALDVSGAAIGEHLRASWLPKVVHGWFFKAETFWAVARYLDAAGPGGPDFLSHSHGEGFLRIFRERFDRQGLYLLDEPESALSPDSQLELLGLLDQVQHNASAQVIMATHSPLLMAVPGARLLSMTRDGLRETTLEATRHFRMMRDFFRDPSEFVAAELRRKRSPDSAEED